MAKTLSSSKRPTGRPGGTLKHLKPRADSSRNASGYKKRQERRAKSQQTTDPDVYEYATNRNKRAHVALEMDKDELMGQGKPQFDDSDDDMETLRKKIAANMEGDLGVVDSEDDEDIDSDAAFEGESDEERFVNFKFAEKPKISRKNKSKASIPPISPHEPEVNLDEDSDDDDVHNGSKGGHRSEDESEDEEDPDEEEEEGGISLSAMLEEGIAGEEEESGEEGSDGESDEDDVLAPSDDEVEEANDDALEKLDSFIEGLNSRKRKASAAGESDAAASRKRRVLPDRTEAGVEGEFAVPGGSLGTKLSLNDLFEPLEGSGSSSSTAALAKSAKLLTSLSNQPLAAPLHQRQQERVDREAAYEATKEEVQKWAPTMKRIREAEHLSFPLQAAPAANTSTGELTSRFKPSTALESAVDKLLKSSKLREQDIEKTEELQMANLTMEEVAARRTELRQMRELMFRAEAKAKRVSKIKSKAFRRIQKKAREKQALTLEQIEQLDPEAAEAERLKLEAARARERATMRHKNTGKWAKQLKARGANMDVDQRRELNEQLERGEQLRRKIHGIGEDGEPPESDSDSDGGDTADVAARAFDELAALDNAEAETSVSVKKKKTGLLDMKFMRDAEARKQRDVKAMADDFQAELLGFTTAEDEDAPQPEATPSASQAVGGNPGRLVFRPAAEPSSSRLVASATPVPHASNDSDASSVTLKSSVESVSNSPLLSGVNSLSAENPWLKVSSSTGTGRISKRKQEAVVSKDSSLASKSKAALKKQLGRTEEALAQEADDAVVEISLDNVMTLDQPPETAGDHSVSSKKKSSTSQNTPEAVVDSAFRNSDDEGDDAEERRHAPKAFQQRELVALAFAGDNVVEEFSAQKQKEVQSEAPSQVDLTLPGWGSWGGRGAKKGKAQAPKPHLIKKIAGIAPAARADAGKAHVIISEKKDKKAGRYLVKDLPHPYTSKQQFERSLETPVGPEWNTRTAFQKGTLPKVVKKIGTIIDPIEKLF